MREIKFRAWDKAYKAMCQTNDGTEHLSSWLKNPDIFVVMQYTGLRDRNGAEIYEGDVVKIEGPGGHPVHRGCQRGVVEWETYEWAIDRTLTGKRYGGHNLGFLHLELTVIGNIYEKPELLEEVV